jgi:alpha-ketoglutarate-dependent taurine dioxygenase
MNVMRGYSGPRYKHSPDDPAPYDTITVDKLTPIIGAEIGGVDLAQPLGNRTFQDIHRALAENQNPLFQCRFRWQENSIAFWDNRCAQHRAMWDYWPHTRSGHRVTVQGDRPV